jgi:HAD superfamily hydrolase (TIGR01509 family)
MPLAALIWDVDGTLAETERDGHRVAFNAAFESLGLSWRWSVAHYGELLTTTGGYERLLRDLAHRDDAPAAVAGRQALARELHRRKNAAYAQRVAAGAIALRPGVERLMDEALTAGARMAIATTTSRSNVEALLGRHLGARWAQRFGAIVCAEDAPLKKPHPQAYLAALRGLGVAADQALAVEDSPAGLASAGAAGVRVLLVRSVYFPQADPNLALAACEHLDAPVRAVDGSALAQRVEWAWLQGIHESATAVTGHATER